jgi:hypothetical protein
LLRQPGHRATGYELTASYRSNGEVVSSPFEVTADADSRALRIKPLGPSLANTFKTLCGVHGSFVGLAKAFSLDRVEYVVDQQPMGWFAFARHVQDVDHLVYPDRIDGFREIVLTPVHFDARANGHVQLNAFDCRTKQPMAVIAPIGSESEVYGYDRLTVAASVALDANAQMRFRRELQLVDFGYRPEQHGVTVNPFVGVAETASGRGQRTRFLFLSAELLVADRANSVRSVTQSLTDKGVLPPATDPLLVASADAIVGATIVDVGTRDRRAAAAVFSGAAAGMAAAPFLEALPQTIAAGGFVLGVALASRTMATSKNKVGTLVADCRLFGSGRRDESPALGASSRALNIRGDDSAAERVRKFAIAAFLRDDIANAYRAQLSSLMRPLPKVDDGHEVPGR